MVVGADVSYRVVTAIAEREGVDPTELYPPLYEVVDPDALDALVGQSASQTVTVSFTYNGYAVDVSKADGVRISNLTDGDGSVESAGDGMAE